MFALLFDFCVVHYLLKQRKDTKKRRDCTHKAYNLSRYQK